jgi:3-dehydrotetronate 4-kinase
MSAIQLIGTPSKELAVPETDAVVIALKSRTIPAKAAVELSVTALHWLRNAGARQFLFKYCSTFDSTDVGNIGPVADALLDDLGQDFTIACPAFPENGRTVYQGHLFVGDQLLSDSPMRDHPLTPMSDSNLVRVLGRQTAGRVGLIPYGVVGEGPKAVRHALEQLRSDGFRYVIVDALEERNLEDIGTACEDLPLLTGGSGVAMGLPENFRRRGLLRATDRIPTLPHIDGYSAVLSGSCSTATLAQVAEGKRAWPAFFIDPLALAAGEDVGSSVLSWARPRLKEGPVIIYSSAVPDEVARVQEVLGRERASQLVEHALATVARDLVAIGVRRIVVAGGETAGAVVKGLGIGGLQIGPQIDPGVPWTFSLPGPPIALALKSGNFGTPDFFIKALEMTR